MYEKPYFPIIFQKSYFLRNYSRRGFWVPDTAWFPSWTFPKEFGIVLLPSESLRWWYRHDTFRRIDLIPLAGSLQFFWIPGEEFQKRNLKILRKRKQWCSDSTFKTHPSIFMVLGSVHAVNGDRTSHSVALPLVALLSTKQELQYKAVYQVIADVAEYYRIDNFAPETIMSDFETGIINAASSTFPEAEIKCCSLFLKWWIYRHIQELGL